MIRHILFSEYEAFKLREFMLRAEKHLPVKFDLFINTIDEGVFGSDEIKEEIDEKMRYTEAYDKVINDLGLQERCSSIQFMHSTPLKHMVLKVMDGHGPDDLICLMTTDEMLVSDVDEQAVEKEFQEKMLMTFSLRLGKNIVRNSMVGMNNKVVPVTENGITMRWDWDKHYVDFSGPLSVHGHYYRTKELYRMVNNLRGFSSYDELEEELQAYMNFPKKLMASFIESKAVSIDPLLYGDARHQVHLMANNRLLRGEPIPIEVGGPQEEMHFYPFKDILAQMTQWKKQRILFKYPARGRKEKFLSTLKKYHDNIINKDDFQFLISIDEDDLIINAEEVKTAVAAFPNTKLVVGASHGKIHAINRDMEQADPWDIVVLVSDDMIPKMKGFDMLIRKDMHRHFPDFDGVLWYNDGHQGDKLNTLCILGKTYYDRFGHIYWPGYKSLFCDNDFMEVSKRLGKVHYNSLCIIEHQHWAWGYGEMDELYQKNEKHLQEDRDLFQKRLAENFGLPKEPVLA